MSDEEKSGTETAPTAPAAGPAAQISRPPNILTRPTDHVARPGFRNKPNEKSKAQKKQGGKQKKRG